MANCCDYSLCEGLATIGFMRSLIPSVMSSCVTVKNGRSATTCCGNTTEADYIPKYSEITSHTFAPLRATASTPSNDVNGFTYVTPTLVTTDCCTGDTLANEALMKSQLGFEYTSAVTCSHINIIEPTYCNLNYGLTVRKEWDRHRYECDANSSGNIKHTTNGVIDTSETPSGRLSRTITSNGNNYTFSFGSFTVTSETTAQCSERKSASTTFDLSPYTVGFSLICPSQVSCEGGEYTIATIDKLKCDDDISLEITCDIEGSTETYILNGSTTSASSLEINIGRNDIGITAGTISVSARIGGNREGSFTDTASCTFQRRLCEWSPSYGTSDDCSIYTLDWVWDGPNVTEHSCS